MRMLALCLILIATLAMAADEPTRVGDVSTTFRMVGRNDKIVIDRMTTRQCRASAATCLGPRRAAPGARSGFRLIRAGSASRGVRRGR
jgi:hypothetical protein